MKSLDCNSSKNTRKMENHTSVEQSPQIYRTCSIFEKLDTVIFHSILGYMTLTDCIPLLQSNHDNSMRPLTTNYDTSCYHCDFCLRGDDYLCEKGYRKHTLQFFNMVIDRAPKEIHSINLSGWIHWNDESVALKMKNLFNLNKLTICRLSSSSSIHETMKAVSIYCPQIRELTLKELPVDDSSLIEVFTHCSHLENITLVGCHRITDQAVNSMMTLGNSLKSVSLWGCHNISNDAIIRLGKACRRIRKLNLRYCHKIMDSAIIAIAENMEYLEDIDLRYCFKITDESVVTLCRNQTGIKKLNLSQCLKITDSSIMLLTQNLLQLEELRLWGCTGIKSNTSIKSLASLKQLRLLDIRGSCSLIPFVGGPATLWKPTENNGIYKREVPSFKRFIEEIT